MGLTGGVALGFFAAGCAPGGGSSNMYTLLLGGDVSLSVTLTLISIGASLCEFFSQITCYKTSIIYEVSNVSSLSA